MGFIRLYDTQDYIEYIKSKPCRVCGKLPVDPDHLEARGMGGAGKGGTVTGTIKDYYTIPLCRTHHTERGSLGNKRFEEEYAKYRLNVWKDACKLIVPYFLGEEDED